MSEKVEIETTGKKVNSFIEKHKKALVTFLVVIIVAIIAFVVFFTIGKSSKTKDLARIDEITYTLIDNSLSADDAELTARRTTGIEKLQDLTSKIGIVGARANMLCADLSYQLEKYEDSINYWNATASKGKGTYIEPIAYYNLGVCYEHVGKLQEAADSYKVAAENPDFILYTHAYFSYGRTLESLGNYTEAVEVYKTLNDKAPNDSWANLAKSRILTLQAEGKIK